MNMSLLLILLITGFVGCQAVVEEEVINEEWKTFKLQHQKKYDTFIEEGFRKKMYMYNSLIVAKHNAKYAMGNVSFKLKMNQFGDMLRFEYANIMNRFNKTKIGEKRSLNEIQHADYLSPANVELPTFVDWRKQGAVTQVKDQGRCGSCWAFSTTGALEGQHFRETGVLVSLSEQNLIDCTFEYGNNGCNGGLMENAYTYIKNNKGIDKEKEYPYEAKKNTCHYNPRTIGAIDVGFVDITSGDEEKLKAAVATVGPISAAIDASQSTFQLYGEGIYDEPKCTYSQLDHAILIVGYGTDEDGKDYWIVKNSWGESWGEKGYVKIARNKNMCGIAMAASYPLV